MSDELGKLIVKVNLDGSNFQKGVANLNRQMKLVETEFKASSALLSNFGKGTDGLKLKTDSLTKQIALQKSIVDELNGSYQKSVDAKGKDDKATQAIGNQLNKAIAKYGTLKSELDATNKKLSEQSSRWNTLGSHMQRASEKLQTLGQHLATIGTNMSLYLSAPITAMAGESVKASMDFESAFASVRKTVDGSEADFKKLEKGIRDMAKQMPVSTDAIAEVAAEAGQLGVKKEDILSFTRTMIMMGETSNLSATDAADALARLANITQMPQNEFDRLGNTVVALGNGLAATESDVTNMGLRLAGAGHQIGLTEPQILSFAGALSSVGVDAEAGGTAFSRVFVKIANSVDSGDKKLKEFAKVAGMSVKDFQKKFKTDAAGALVDFIEGLGKMHKAGQNTFQVLDELGMSDIRVRDALLRASGAGDLFRQSLELGNKAWKENNALTEKANQRYNTSASRLKIAWNRIKDIAITLGDSLVPALMDVVNDLKPFLDMVAKMADAFHNMSPATQRAIIAIGAIVVAVGPALVVIGNLVSSVGAIAEVFGSASLAIGEAGGLLAVLTGPVGIIAAAVAGLVAVGVLLWKNWDQITAKMKEMGINFAPLMKAFQQAGEQLSKSFAPIWQSLVHLFETLKPVLIVVGAVIAGALIVALELLIPLLTAVVAAIGPLIETFLHLVNVVVDGVMGVIALMGGDFPDAMKYFKRSMGEGVRAIISIWHTLKNFFVTFFDTVFAYFKSFTGIDLAPVGKNIIRGLLLGLTSMAPELWKKAEEIATGIEKRIKKALDIQSPSRVMMKIGRFTGEGLAIGMNRSIPNIASQANLMARATIPAIGSSRGGSGHGHATSTYHISIPINFNKPVMMKDKEDAKAIVNELAPYMSQALQRINVLANRSKGVVTFGTN